MTKKEVLFWFCGLAALGVAGVFFHDEIGAAVSLVALSFLAGVGFKAVRQRWQERREEDAAIAHDEGYLKQEEEHHA